MSIEQSVEKWNNGEISNGELLGNIVAELDHLFAALDDLRSVIVNKETADAEAGYKNAGLLG